MDRKAMYRLSYGLFVLTAREAEKDNGCIINTAIQAASEPNQLSICVNKTNYTHDMIERTGKFTVSVLSQNAQFELFKHFGFQSGRNTNKFETFKKCDRGINDIYYITEGTNAYISVKVIYLLSHMIITRIILSQRTLEKRRTVSQYGVAEFVDMNM